MKYIVLSEYVPASVSCGTLEEVRKTVRKILLDFNKDSDVYTNEELEEKAASAAGWCETATENDGVYEGECFDIKVRPEYRTFYTLRRRTDDPMKYDIFSVYGEEIEFGSYEEAYDKMADIYLTSKKATDQPIRYGIWKTSVSGNNSMTQAVWSA